MADAGPAKTNLAQFATVNVAELLERLAYYGAVSVFSLHLLALGHDKPAVGLLLAILLPLPYLVSLLAGPVGEKVGFKATMLAAFVLYAAGFLVVAVAQPVALIALGLLLIGVGAGLFKPLTAAAIALVTAPEKRTLGYAIYYTGINVGGFLGPLALAVFGTAYQLGFLLAAAVIAADFVLVLVFFRNQQPARPQTSIPEALRPLGEVLRNGRFIALLAIFAGFWLLYSMMFSFLTPYVAAFVPLPDWFSASLQQSISPFFIILLGIPLGGFAARRGAVRMMTVGIALFVVGFVLIGFVPTFWALVLGILLAAIGEVLAYPGFLAYVASIAPPGRVAVYQSYGFLPIFAGFFVGPFVGGFLYKALVDGAGRPALFWAILCSVGLLTVAAFLLYARNLARRDGVAAPRHGGTVAVGVILLVPLLLLAALAGGAAPKPVPPPIEGATFFDQSGLTAEGQSSEKVVALPQAVGNLTVELTWRDEPAAFPGSTNAPDRLRLALRAGATKLAEDEQANPLGDVGRIRLVVPAAAAGGNLTVVITVVSAGEVGTSGLTLATDSGNSWQLVVAGQRQAATS